MVNINDTGLKIRCCGSNKEIGIAGGMITDIFSDNASEASVRLAVQEKIDEKKLKSIILVDGNIVWSYDRIIRDFKRALNSKPCKLNEYGSGEWDMTKYLYEFLHLSCGSIAHYNKYGWIGNHPEKKDLMNFFVNDNLESMVFNSIPGWNADVRRIVEEIERIIKERRKNG